ncbi:putative ribonuclease h protein [Quercus suber]|uniref:Ribonuclease h protein n=1 Tax=Quercus suber TaxID=58331 RepID=A0AAW0KCF7_QUESU
MKGRDRGVANYDWVSKFPAATVRHLHCHSSDHRPISLVFNPNNESQRWFRKPFCFEEIWLSDNGCSDMVNCIKSISVSIRASEDLLIWPQTPDGSYTVRSAYRMLAMASHNAQLGTSNLNTSKKLWSGIWKLQVPSKVRHFMWRASGEALPTRSNLRYRHVLVDGTCNLCEDHPEDAMHCLWMYDYVKCIWLSDPTFNFPRAKCFNNFCDLVLFVLSEATSSTAALFAMVAWCIWVRPNKLREGQQVWDVSDTIQRAWDL